MAGLQHLFELSDPEVSKLIPYLAELLEADPEQHIRPRWNLLQHCWVSGLGACVVCAVLALWFECMPRFVELQESFSLLTSGASFLALATHC